MHERKKLSDILSLNSDRERLQSAWRETKAAAEFAPLPPGEYPFRILSGELFTSKSRGTPGYKLALEVTEGEFEGRRAWVDLWLTPAALPMSKRDLAKIGVTDLEQLEQPLPAGILLKGKLALRRDDDGNESNRLVRFECIGIEPGDAFEPKEDDVGLAGTDQDGAGASDFPFGLAAQPAEGSSPPAANGTAPAGSNGKPPAGTNGTAAEPKGAGKPADTAATGGGADQ